MLKFFRLRRASYKSLYTNLFMLKKMPPEGRRKNFETKFLYVPENEKKHWCILKYHLNEAQDACEQTKWIGASAFRRKIEPNI